MKMCDENSDFSSIRTFIALPLGPPRDENDKESCYQIIKNATIKTLPNGVMCVAEEKNNFNENSKFVDQKSLLNNVTCVEGKNFQDVTSEFAADNEAETQKNTHFLYKCLMCKEMFNKIILYRKHMMRHQNIKKYRCTKCSAGYNVELNLKIHMAMHGEGKPVCPLCDISFQRFASLKSHLMLHQVEEIYTCQQCTAEFEKEEELIKHIQNHTVSVSELICSYCSVRFDDHKVYKEHISHHVKVKKLVLSGKKKRKIKANKEHRHVCSVCLKRFSRISLLERHLRIHSGERPFVCSHCNRSFNQKGTLQIHLNKHTGIKPFRCTLCSAKFNQKGNLRVHVEKTHTAPVSGVKIYKCPHCTCIFKKIASLNVHITKFHVVIEDNISNVMSQLKELEEQTAVPFNSTTVAEEFSEHNKRKVNDVRKENEKMPDVSYLKLAESFLDGTVKQYLVMQKKMNNMKSYVCNYCSKEFKKPSDLIRHTRVHTKEKPFKCKQCGASFSLKSTLFCHTKTHSNSNNCSCTVCMKNFSSLRSLNSHLRRHAGKENNEEYKLVKCNDNFDTLYQGREDDVEFNKDIRKEATEQTNTFNKTHKIGLHSISSSVSLSCHSEESPTLFHCHICKLRFTKVLDMNRHMLIHQTEKQFKCSYCLKSYCTAQALKNHRLYHFGVKNYVCKVCGKKFLTAPLLKRHTINHSIQRSYVCLYCNKDFKSIALYKRHINIHKKLQNTEIGLLPSLETVQNTNEVKDVLAIQPHTEGSNKLPVTRKCEMSSKFHINSEENESRKENSNIDPVEYKTLQQIDQMHVPILINYNDVQLTNNLNIQNTDAALFNPLSELQDGNTLSFDSLSNSNMNAQTTEIYNINHFILNIDNTETNYKSNNHKMNVVLVNENVENNMQLDFHSSLRLFNIETNVETDDCVLPGVNLNLPDVNLNGRDLSNTGILQQHAEEIIDNKRKTQTLNCDKCDKIFTNSNNYSKHVINFHTQQNGIKLRNCSFCFKGFKKQSDLVRHVRTHTGERPFACNTCEKKFSLKSTLLSHQRTHSPVSHKHYNCVVCNSFFTSKSSLKVHMSVHTGDKTHECSFCSLKFRTAAHKKSHENSHHINPSKRNKTKVTNLLASVAMDAVNQQMVNLQNIQTLTTENLENVLVVQGEPAINDDVLKEDNADSIKQSVQLEPIVIQQCQANFLIADHILSSSIHLDDGSTLNVECTEGPQKESCLSVEKTSRNFECDVCYKKYASKDVLRRHKKIHGINKKFPCHKCDKGFDAKEDLEKHDKTHIGFRPYSCMHCSNSFTKENGLTIHMKRIHNISVKDDSLKVCDRT